MRNIMSYYNIIATKSIQKQIIQNLEGGFSLIELMVSGVLASFLISSFLWVVVNLQSIVETAYGVSQINAEARLLDNLINEGAYHQHTVSAPGVNNWIPGITDSSEINITGVQTLTTSNGAAIKIGDNSYVKIISDRLYLLSGGTDPAVNPNFASSETNTTVFCVGFSDPHQDCTGTETFTVSGMFKSAIFDAQTRNLGNNYLDSTVVLAHPVLTYRNKQSDFYKGIGEEFFFVYSRDDPGNASGTASTVPKTGMTTSYAANDDGDLQQGVTWPSPRFSDNGNGTVTDNLTKLIWLKNANCFGTRDWSTALSDANGLANGFCGLTDGSIGGSWRLPSINELRSIGDLGTSNPALSVGHPFTDTNSGWRWSSTTMASWTVGAWVVNLGKDDVGGMSKAQNSVVRIWPVRGEAALVQKTGQTSSYALRDDGDLKKGVAWPTPRFTDNGDGTVTDNLTNLIWLQQTNCFGEKDWPTALTDASNLATGICGLSDSSVAGEWRLPNMWELESLVDFGQYNPALPSVHPFADVQVKYCSSNPFIGNPAYVFYIDINSGNMFNQLNTSICNIWPVRKAK